MKQEDNTITEKNKDTCTFSNGGRQELIPSIFPKEKTPIAKVRRIERGNITSVTIGPSIEAREPFQRIVPKYPLIEELEWKPAKSNHSRQICIIIALAVMFMAYFIFKVRKELGVTAAPRQSELPENLDAAEKTKQLHLSYDRGIAGFENALELLQRKGTIKHHGKTIQERTAAASLRTSLDLVIQIELRELNQNTHGVEVITCCHEGKNATNFILYISGIRKDIQTEILKEKILGYSWDAAVKCVNGNETTLKNNLNLVLIFDDAIRYYEAGEKHQGFDPGRKTKQEIENMMRIEFSSWNQTESQLR